MSNDQCKAYSSTSPESSECAIDRQSLASERYEEIWYRARFSHENNRREGVPNDPLEDSSQSQTESSDKIEATTRIRGETISTRYMKET